jgi:hypothetical protein
MLAVSLAWIAALPPPDDRPSPTDSYARLLLPALALMECLQAYPIAGTQLSIATLSVVLVGAVILNDGLTQVRSWAGRRNTHRIVAVARFVPVTALTLSVAATGLWALLAAETYEAASPLGLTGAQLLRVSPAQQAALQSVSVGVRQKCTSFITMPAMPSLYLWAGQDAPAPLFATDWIFNLDSVQQQSIVDQVRTLPGVCVVRNNDVVAFWAEGRSVPRGPLIDFIESNFAVSSTYGDYEVLSRIPTAS